MVFFKPLLLHVPYANPSIFCGRIFTDIWESRREAWRPPCKGYCYSINSDIFSIFDVATTQIDCMHPLWIKTILANGGNMRWRMVLCSLTWCFLNLFSLTWYFTLQILKKTSGSYAPIFSMICFTQNSNLSKGFADCVFGPFCDWHLERIDIRKPCT